MNLSDLKSLLLKNDPTFWSQLALSTHAATNFDDLIFLSTLRKKALTRVPNNSDSAKTLLAASDQPPLRLAILGGYSLYPLHELLIHLLAVEGIGCELFLGDYDNYIAEISETDSALYQFCPHVIFLLPGLQRCKYSGAITDSAEAVQTESETVAKQLIELCRVAHERSHAEILLANFILPARHDLGAARSKIPASDWNFRKQVNLKLGFNSPSFVQLCDLEFLSTRLGTLASEDARSWFESKQPCSPTMIVELAREAARLIGSLRAPPKKVLVLDLDNTLWGGIVAEDGLEGIEIGDTSPRAEAFKAFQKYIVTLKQRGVLLAICSKNDYGVALEPFEKHPEMVLSRADFVSFMANWEPKSDNLKRIAAEWNLGLDSFVFVDDNPAEIEIVRQFAPQVSTILLGADPSEYVGQLQDCRFFESRSFTSEDAQRTGQYQAEAFRQNLLATAGDMDSYLQSLEMTAVINKFTPIDVPRLAQLINKSNQFNLTTRRRTEAEVTALMSASDHTCFSVRLKDRFGDHGLISIVIGKSNGNATMEIDTWLMSCRVLKRQVEEVVLNELAQLAKKRNCTKLAGVYLPTAKNEMVRDFYSRIGFSLLHENETSRAFELSLDTFQPRPTQIKIRRPEDLK